MSAFGVGAGTRVRNPAARERPSSAEAATDGVTAGDPPTVETLVAWIPGEVIAAYMALVLALQSGEENGVVKPTSLWWLVGAITSAGLLTFLGGFSKSRNLSRSEWHELGVKVVLSAIAFVLWSLVLPGSWWQSIDTIADNAAAVAIVAGMGAAVFGLVAQAVVMRLK